MKLGVRGRATTGAYAGRWVLIDSVLMVPVDQLLVVTSQDLDSPRHPSEEVQWVWPNEVDEHIREWNVEWTEIRDDVTGQRFG